MISQREKVSKNSRVPSTAFSEEINLPADLSFRNFHLFYVFFSGEDDYHVAPMSENVDVFLQPGLEGSGSFA